jgi:hypothetical protein
MKITVELDDATLAELVAVTGERKKGPAVAQAVEEFLKRKKASSWRGRLIIRRRRRRRRRGKATDHSTLNTHLHGSG